MHIQGVWEGEKRENVQSEFISFFALQLVHIHSSCADERKICLGAAQEALVDYRVFLFLVVDNTTSQNTELSLHSFHLAQP